MRPVRLPSAKGDRKRGFESQPEINPLSCGLWKSMPTPFKRFTLHWLPLILYCLLIYIQSANPSPEQIPSFPFVDKVLHFVAYGIMGILFYRAFQTLRIKENKQILILLSVISATLYGISDEIHQSFIPFRDAEISDIIADFIGSACGVWLYHLWMTSRMSQRLWPGIR